MESKKLLLVLAAILILPLVVAAQLPLSGPPSATESQRAADSNGYRIGSGDLLEIHIFGVDELNSEVRVDSGGFISLPRIDSPINVQCLTELQLAQLLESKYSKYIRNPHVDVLVKEFQSQPVAIIGAVKQAGRFQLRRSVRLLELLTYAGGPNDSAGAIINIVHNQDLPSCLPEAGSRPPLESVLLKSLLEGKPEANFYVQPGDIITVPNADVIYVAGNVIKPGPQPFHDRLTVTKAIALAGGLNTNSAKEKIRILRQNQDKDSDISVDLLAIEKKKAEDIELQVNDIIIVPDAHSPGKAFLRTVVSALGIGLGSAPLTVIR
ncbi:MAG: polysaccharide biosynthesis/export family protein [Acidobacteriota bacterium]